MGTKTEFTFTKSDAFVVQRALNEIAEFRQKKLAEAFGIVCESHGLGLGHAEPVFEGDPRDDRMKGLIHTASEVRPQTGGAAPAAPAAPRAGNRGAGSGDDDDVLALIRSRRNGH